MLDEEMTSEEHLENIDNTLLSLNKKLNKNCFDTKVSRNEAAGGFQLA